MYFSLLIYFNNNPLQVSNRLNIYNKEIFFCKCSMCYLSRITLASS